MDGSGYRENRKRRRYINCHPEELRRLAEKAKAEDRCATESSGILERIANYFEDKATGAYVLRLPDSSNTGAVTRKLHRATLGEDSLQRKIQSVRDAEKMWQEHRGAVDSLEAAAEDHPVEVLEQYVRFAEVRSMGARRILLRRYGVGIEGGRLLEKARLVPDGVKVDLDDAEDVAALGDTMWSFMLSEDIRVGNNHSLTEAIGRGEDIEKAARAACETVTHILRSRPMISGVFALRPDFLEGRKGKGLAEVQEAALIVLAGWVKANLKLSDWIEHVPQDNGKFVTKVGTNKLRVALEDLAEKRERASDVLLHMVSPATLAELERLIRTVEEEGPERAMRKLGRRKLGPTILRNLVAEHIGREERQQHELERTGNLAEPVEIVDSEADDFATREAAREQIRDACKEAGLSQRESEVLMLRGIEDMDTHEIAGYLGIGEKTVYTYDLRAEEKLNRFRKSRLSA